MKPKTIQQVYQADHHNMGAFGMQQPIPVSGLSQIDPFILLHHHGPHHFDTDNQGLPFGPHPHRGFETVTLIYHGNIEHKDSRGHRSTIGSGGVQWMTAGMGIIHSENINKEMRENGGDFEIIQLWVNLPSALKMVQPKYQGFQNELIPEHLSPDKKVKVRIYSGDFNGIEGPVESLTGIMLVMLYMKQSGTIDIPVNEEKSILLYVLDGSVIVNDQPANAGNLVKFGEDGDAINITANKDSRVLFATAKVIKEPVVSHGPYVMNTQTEILEAMRDYQIGKMGVLIEE